MTMIRNLLDFDPLSVLTELATRDSQKFEHYFTSCRPGCVVDSTTVLNVFRSWNLTTTPERVLGHNTGSTPQQVIPAFSRRNCAGRCARRPRNQPGRRGGMLELAPVGF
jgi:hypothetical protein